MHSPPDPGFPCSASGSTPRSPAGRPLRQHPMTAALLALVLVWPSAAVAGSASSLMDISSDGKFLACANRDSGTVSIVELPSHTLLHEVPVGAKPEGVTFLGPSHQLAVAVYDDDRIGFIQAVDGQVVGFAEVFDEPYGVVSNADGTRLFVTLDYPGCVVEIDVAARTVLRQMQAASFARGLAIDTSDSRLYVTEYYTGDVVAVDIETGEVVDRWPGSSNDNLARQIVLHPHRNKAYLAHIRSRVSAVHGEGSIFPYVSILDLVTPTEPDQRRRRRIPMDAFRGALVTANPWDCAISPDGRTFFVVFAGTNDMFACDVIDDDYQELGYREYLRVGHNPRAVRIAPDGQTAYVYNALDFEVVAYDVESLEKGATIRVTDPPLDERTLRGKRLFYTALQPMAARRWISCSSCHPDGQPDGRTWANPEGPRNTQALAGLAWTHPIHWSADRDEVQDFEHTIRGPLMQGRGLLQGALHPELGEPHAALSDDLDALAAYSNSHTYTLSPHAKHGLSEQAERGRQLFFDEATGCAQCHSGPFYTDSLSGRPIVKHDVDTGGDPAEKLPPDYDTPSLLGCYRTAPYLHHGKAETLEQVLTTYNPSDQHGRTSHLKPDQIADLVEFLKALPYEDPVPAAIQAGMKKVDR